MNKQNKILIGIRDELRSFAEDKKSEMSVNVYNYIWNIVQGIDHDLEEIKKEICDCRSFEECYKNKCICPCHSPEEQ